MTSASTGETAAKESSWENGVSAIGLGSVTRSACEGSDGNREEKGGGGRDEVGEKGGGSCREEAEDPRSRLLVSISVKRSSREWRRDILV